MGLTRTTYATADDSTRLALRHHGADDRGTPLLCLPGGPMLDSAYLGDLGGLDRHVPLVRLDLRGTGGSERPDDLASYRCDRQVADVEAVRRHLGLDRLDVLAHSAGANLAYRYAEAHPDRIGRLVLVTPSPRGLGIDVPDHERSAVAAGRAGEPWYDGAASALRRIQAGNADPEDWAAITPFTHGRWDDEERAHEEWMDGLRIDELAEAFGADGAYAPGTTRTSLAALETPVLVLAGEHDTGNPPPAMARLAAVFRTGRLVVQDGAGHYPWRDDPDRFVACVTGFLLDATDR